MGALINFFKKLFFGRKKEKTPAQQNKSEISYQKPETPSKPAKPVQTYQKPETPSKPAKPVQAYQKPETPSKPAKPVQTYQKPETPSKPAKPVQQKCTILKPFQNHNSYISKLEKLSQKLNSSFPENAPEPIRVKELKAELASEIFHTSAGDKGEKLVYDKLCSIPKNMVLLHDFYLSGQNNESAQSDFILITPRLILVLECKHWKSEIKISYDNQTKKLICGDYDDPLSQNQKHIQMIQNTCKNPEMQKRLCSLIVFSNQNQIQIQNPQIWKQVVLLEELETRIQTLEAESQLSPMSQEVWKKTVSWFSQNCKENPLYQKILQRCSAECSRLLHETPLGDCPVCTRAVYASDAENSDYCKCGMNLRKIYGGEISSDNLKFLLQSYWTLRKTKNPVTVSAAKEYVRHFPEKQVICQNTNGEPERLFPAVKENHWISVKYDALCPNCQKPVKFSDRKQKNTLSCSCGMLLYAVPDSLNQNRKIFLTNEQTKQLLSHTPVQLRLKNENRIFKISPEINQESKPPVWKTKEYYLCPQCGQILFRLSGLCQDCGMNLQSVHFGKIKINAFQVKQLLTGKKLEFSAEEKKFIVFPYADPNNHERIKFQWHYEEKK